MKIHFSEIAAAQIRKKVADDSTILKLVYDTEGCGCAVNGIAQLWLVNGKEQYDQTAEGSLFHVVYDSRQEVFFEEQLTVDYSEGSKVFMLKSSQQIYNARMPLLDKRKSPAHI